VSSFFAHGLFRFICHDGRKWECGFFKDLLHCGTDFVVADDDDLVHHVAADAEGLFAGGSHGATQLIFRPTVRLRPYRTPNPRLLICSASTPPGAGVHGMCGHHAANAALRGVLS